MKSYLFRAVTSPVVAEYRRQRVDCRLFSSLNFRGSIFWMFWVTRLSNRWKLKTFISSWSEEFRVMIITQYTHYGLYAYVIRVNTGFLIKNKGMPVQCAKSSIFKGIFQSQYSHFISYKGILSLEIDILEVKTELLVIDSSTFSKLWPILCHFFSK